MSQEKYIGMDVHQATISVAVVDADGKLIMECLLETNVASRWLSSSKGGTLSLTFEEGTSAAWLHDLLTVASASSLSVSDRRGLFHLWGFSRVVVGRVLEMLGSRAV